MKILAINSCNYGSTGNIMLQIADAARQQEHTVITCCPLSRDNKKKTIKNQWFIGNRFSRNIHLKLFKYTGFNGCFSIMSTLTFLYKLDKFKPDIVHLHNLHNCYVNLPMLFRYLKKRHIKTIWTLHDCWSFTGQCPHFTMAKCTKWKVGCHDCTQIGVYPASKVDRTRTMWKLKQKWFTGVEDMIIVTPSEWLASLVRQSYLRKYPVKVINNGIDLNTFKPTINDFRQKYHLENKYILLGVAFGWGKQKGLDVFIELAKRLDDKFQIVLVGTNDDVDKLLPTNIISVHKTNNQKELAEIYTAADIFVNPTREEVLGLVNIEALACGTPVITFDTGGSPECIDKMCGVVVNADDIDALIHSIKNTAENNYFNTIECIRRANMFNRNDKYEDYIELYEKGS